MASRETLKSVGKENVDVIQNRPVKPARTIQTKPARTISTRSSFSRSHLENVGNIAYPNGSISSVKSEQKRSKNRSRESTAESPAFIVITNVINFAFHNIYI